MSSFFEYPNLALRESAGDLVFLADCSEEDWQKLLAHTDCGGSGLVRKSSAPATDLRCTSCRRACSRYSCRGRAGAAAGSSRSRRHPSWRAVIRRRWSALTTLRAVSDGELRRLSLESFEVLAAREPELARAVLFDIARILSHRLRTTTRFIAEWVA